MRKQKILAIVAACLMVTACPCVVTAGEVEQQEVTTEVYGAPENVILSGDCSATDEDHVQWQVVRKEDGKFKLIIFGTGNMQNEYYWHTDEDDFIHMGGVSGLPENIERQLAKTYGEDVYISDVEIREGVKNAGGFYDSKIERISLPNGITSIPGSAFDRCENLSEINIPDSVTYIGTTAFGSCEKLKNIKLPANLDTLEWRAFTNSCLTSVTIPAVKNLKGYEFADCKTLKKAVIEEGNKCISEYMFADWLTGGKGDRTSLEEVVLPRGLKTIGRGAFLGCSKLKAIDIPDSVTTIEEGAFNNCRSLKEINIPNGVTVIEDGAFYGCSGIKELRIPEGVKEIGGVWNGCTDLKTIYLPHSIEKIYSSAEPKYSYTMYESRYEYEEPVIAYGTSLTDIYYDGTKEEWEKIKKYLPHITTEKWSNEMVDENGNPYIEEHSNAKISGWDETDENFINKGVTVHFLQPEKPTSSPSSKPIATVKPAATATPTPTAAPAKENSVTMYRLYNALNKEHFYTASTHEKDVLVTRGWKYEGVGWYAPEKSNTPVYRLYNPFVRDHHYTTDANEKNVLSSKYGWIYEGIGWYSDDSKGVPLYRRYCPILKSGSHHYTTALNEAKHLVSVGWKDEGIAWYGLKTEKK